MATPDQMYDHELNGVKGFVPGQNWVVDKAVDLDSSVNAANVEAGMVAHMDPTSKKFKLGCATPTAIFAPVPFFLFQGGQDFDVLGDDGNMVGATSAGYASRLMGLAAVQGAEIESTEYDSGTYTPGTLLTGGTDGKLEVTPDNTSAVIICGSVTDGVITSEHESGVARLRFHTCFVIKFPAA